MNPSEHVGNPQPAAPFVPFDVKDATESLTERFERQVGLHAERIAVKTQHKSITYAFLNRAANRLAHAVMASQGGAGSPVALLFKQGPGLLTANLAVLKTARPFVQIDYSLPRQGAARILQDAGANLVITDREHFSSARSLAGADVEVISLDDLNQSLCDRNPEITVSPDAIAYIHYTSGSTGEPKGVVSTHRSELHSIRVKTNALRIAPDDRISLLRSNNVGATSDALLGLLNGATLCPLELKEAGLAGLADWLIAEGITLFTCVASVFRHAVRILRSNRRFSRIRLIHVGGEPLYQSDIELYRRHFADGCVLVNRLGISETKTASYFFVDKDTAITEPVVPVGFPLAGYEIAVLDERGEALGANLVGEIAVNSAYLALGYWRRPEMTRAKFLADPAGGDRRTYLTGDLGYLRPDGCLVHVGRKDFQVKVRGHRVELGEIESALLEIGAVEEAVVVARDNADRTGGLVAYVVTAPGRSLTAQRLRRILRQKLPGYKIPNAFVFLPRLPLTPSGKIDRRALPLPGGKRDGLENSLVPPRSAVEQVLALVWRQALQAEEIGIDDDFTALGGDSLNATRIVARVNELFSLATPIQTLLEAPTIAKLASLILAQQSVQGEAERIAGAVLKAVNIAPRENA